MCIRDRVFFNADAKQIAELVDRFGKIRLRDHLVVVKSTAKPNADDEVESFGGQMYSYNVELFVTGGLARGMRRMDDKNASSYEPVLTIHAKSADETVALDKMEWPEHVVIKNEIEGSQLASKRKIPKRQLWQTKVNFENGKPAVDFESGVETKVALWEKGNPQEFDLDKVTYKGTFSVALSEQEVAKLKSGDMWMTTTVGNWAAKPKPNHPKLGIENFDLDLEKAKVVEIAKSSLYYGRIEFEDGKEFKLDPLPWPGAEIAVSFPYAGRVRPDEKGNFQITLTEEQFEQLKARRARKNIYVPRYEKKGQSTALHAFPAEKLTTDENKPGVVTIPRPEAPCGEF